MLKDLAGFYRSQPSHNEEHIWGPPGTGKTEYLRRQIHVAVNKFGPAAVLVISHTKAATRVLADRRLPITPNHLGTLHSVCFHALGCPAIAEAKITLWNQTHPALRLSPHGNRLKELEEAPDEFPMRTTADELYAELSILRARMMRPKHCPSRVHRFAQPWEEWKRSLRLLDFTDLLELALERCPNAPGNPTVIVVDEAQDLSRLQLAVVRQWGERSEHLLLALDDDQSILTFAGADPQAFTNPQTPVRFERTLPKSYRLPRSHHAFSQNWISQVSHRKPKDYESRDVEGELRILHQNYRYPGPILRDLEPYLAAGKNIMVLATASYLLEPLRLRLLECGIPFANPYRLAAREWNPLAAPTRGTAPARRFLCLLDPFLSPSHAGWLVRDMESWFFWLSTNAVRPDAHQQIRSFKPFDTVTNDILEKLLEPAVYQSLSAALTAPSAEPLVNWWLDHLAPNKRIRGRYLARIARRYGAGALRQPPQITIGTGHSVKGAEADVVYAIADLSPAAHRQWIGPRSQRDTLIRLGYVMVTRSRESLILCDPASPGYLPFAACLNQMRRTARI
jgi:superfamily I DNA/RNA helicase